MRIAVDVTPLSVPRSGIGNFIRGVVGGIEDAGCEVVPFALTTGSGEALVQEALGGRDVRALAVPAANVVRRAWSAAGHPSLEKLAGSFDGVLLSDWWYPPQRGGLRSTVVYDLVPLHFPEWVSQRTLLGHRTTYRRLLPVCDVVFAISHFTRNDVVRTLSLEPDRVHVAYPAVDARFTPDGPAVQRDRPYLLVVATIEPRKNLQLVLEAKRRYPDLPDVVVVGGSGWGDVPELAVPGIIPVGRVTDDEVVRYMRGASCFIFPSLYEGFGMPPLEAMACGCPVACSSHPSLDEAVGDVAFRFDPGDPDDLRDAIERALLAGDDVRARGVEHASRFTWAATGAAFRAGYEAASSA